jgi:hypothetical protein
MRHLLADPGETAMGDQEQKVSPEQDAPQDKPTLCACVQDPFAALPPELRPRSEPRMGSLRKVTCPGCGKLYWTNRATDLCLDCEKKGVRAVGENPAEQEE